MKKTLSLFLILLITISIHAQKHKKLGFRFDTKTYNFGDVEQWHNQAAVFTFTNKTKHPVTILPLFSENDLDVVIPERPIKVGESIVIKAMYYTAGKGSFSRKFSIYFGSLAEPVYLRITGNIKSLSPEAYIQCPMSKPELAKQKIELIGDVAEIDTEIPLSGTTIEIIGLQNNKNITLYSTSRGRFGTKLPVGNYMVTIKHPNYKTYNGSIYVGQTSPPLRVRLTPLFEEPLLAQHTEKQEKPTYREKEDYNDINLRDDNLKTKENTKEPKKENYYANSSTNEPKKNEGLKRNIDYVKNEPKDNPYRKEDKTKDIPHTLTTYKESSNNDDVNKLPNKYDLDSDEDNNELDEKPKDSVNDLPDKYNLDKAKKSYSEEKETPNTFKKEEDPYKKEKSKESYIKEEEPNYTNNYKEEKDNPRKEKKPKKENIKDEKNYKPTYDNKEKSIKEKAEKPKKEKVEKTVVPKNIYTFKVIDKKTLDPIEDASIFLNDIYNKRNKYKDQTDIRGFSEIEMTKEDYRFIASADGYISNEIKILKDDKSAIFSIMLSPISDMYDEIYEAKKQKQQEDKEVLDKLSFGKTSFSFAKDEPLTTDENKTPEKVVFEETLVSDNTNDIEKELKKEEQKRKIKEDSIKLFIAQEKIKNQEKQKQLEQLALKEKNKRAKEKEDSLNLVIAQLALANNHLEKDINSIETQKEKNLEKENEKTFQDKKEREKLDSLNLYIKQLLAENKNLEKDLGNVSIEKEQLANQQERDKEIIASLNSKNKELAEPEDKLVLSKSKYAANNILFLIDVSTSMGKAKKMEMLQKSIKNLALVLREIDRVAIITYNQNSEIVLESVSGNKTEKIIAAIDSLKTGGLTNGVRGITAAYEMLEYYFIPEGNNQIILATDGLFSRYNNEMTEFELNKLVKKQAEKNMKLTVVGFGKDEEGKELMTKLARNGDGQYIQIKNEWMTNDILIREIKLNSEKK